jgi:predicted Zn-dependent protease
LKLKNPEAAADQFEAASLMDEKNVAAKLGLAHADLAMKKPVAALDIAKAIAKSDPRNAEAHDLMADALEALGKERDAANARNRARQLRKK